MAVEQGSRTETTATTSTRRSGGRPKDQVIVPVVKRQDVGAGKITPAGSTAKVGRGF